MMSAVFLFAYGSITSALHWLNAAVKYFSISKLEKVKREEKITQNFPFVSFVYL